MKKLLSILSVLLVLALVIGVSVWKLGDYQDAAGEASTSPTDIVAQAPSEEATEAPTDVLVEFPTQEPTEEETIYDPRPHPADVQAEQDRLNEQQDRDEQKRQEEEQQRQEQEDSYQLDPNGYYNTRDEVALYIHIYGRLPNNYITKNQAKSLYGSTKNIPSNMNIGGDRFYNKEGLLPSGHTYYECDIGTTGGRNRGAKRIVFSTDGLIYYTDDHYASFTLLYGEP